MYGCGIAHPTLFYSEVIRIGALPSQKYDIVLQSFKEFILWKIVYFGVDQKVDDFLIKEFLRMCDKGEWEI